MMKQCCRSQGGNMVGPCTCGVFHGQSSSLSMLSCSDHHHPHYYQSDQYPMSVDCTLSLGTPSTRMSSDHRLSYLCYKTSTARSSAANDPPLARRCANCDTTSTPLWRNGPRGPKSLCNACGIRFKKEERRASAAGEHTPAWVHQKTPCYSPASAEYRLIDDVDSRDSFLSWRLNVTDRPGLVVHDFTR